MREQPQIGPLPVHPVAGRGITAIGRLPLLVARWIRAQAVVPELEKTIFRVVDSVRNTPQATGLRALPRRLRLQHRLRQLGHRMERRRQSLPRHDQVVVHQQLSARPHRHRSLHHLLPLATSAESPSPRLRESNDPPLSRCRPPSMPPSHPSFPRPTPRHSRESGNPSALPPVKYATTLLMPIVSPVCHTRARGKSKHAAAHQVCHRPAPHSRPLACHRHHPSVIPAKAGIPVPPRGGGPQADRGRCSFVQLHTASRPPSLRRKPQSRAMHRPRSSRGLPLPCQGRGRVTGQSRTTPGPPPASAPSGGEVSRPRP